MTRAPRLMTVGLLGLVTLLGACGSSKKSPATATTIGTEQTPPGDIPDTQVFVAYTPSAGGYTIEVPQGWAKRVAPATTTFSEHFNSATITVADAAAAPTAASARSATSTALQASAGFHLVKADPVRRSAGTAIRVVYDITSAADPVTGKTVTLEVERYEFWRNGKSVAITLASPKGSDNVDPWKRITDSFSWK